MWKRTRKGNTQWLWQSYGGGWYSWISCFKSWFEVGFNLSGKWFSCISTSRNTCKNSWLATVKAAFCSPTSGLSASASKLNKSVRTWVVVIGAGLLATLVQPRVRAEQLFPRLVYNKATGLWRSEVEEAFSATSAFFFFFLFGLNFKRRSFASCVLCNIIDQHLTTCVYYQHT